MMDYSTDLMIFRGGSAAAFARLDNIKSDVGQAQAFWTYNYNIIGKANEVIAAAEKLGIDNSPVTKRHGQKRNYSEHAPILNFINAMNVST